MAQWSLDLSAWSDKQKDKLDTVVRKIGMDMLNRIVMRSPVDTGRFRANWQVSFDAPLTATVNTTDKTGHDTIVKGAAALQGAVAGQQIWICNNLPYARRLEYGWSRQVPAGMVRVTVREMQAIVDAAAKK